VTDELLPIGAFARLCRLSVKRLRHYDEQGLIEPAAVDERSGYRYYRPGQASQALVVSMLRSLGVPLPTIQRVLVGTPAEGATALAEERERLAADLERRRSALEALERIIRQESTAGEIALREVPQREVIAVRRTAPVGEIGSVVITLVAELAATLDSHELKPRGPIVGLYPLELDDTIEVAVCSEVADARRASQTETLPAIWAAATRHAGPYGELVLAYNALFGWVADNGYRPRGPVRELYVVDPTAAPPDELVTDVLLPIEPPLKSRR
jgi:DNA-binding transcriptional MerR regulator